MSDSSRREMKLKQKRQREYERERLKEKKAAPLTRWVSNAIAFMKDTFSSVPRDRVIRYDNENARRRRQIESGFLGWSSRGVVKLKGER